MHWAEQDNYIIHLYFLNPVKPGKMGKIQNTLPIRSLYDKNYKS